MLDLTQRQQLALRRAVYGRTQLPCFESPTIYTGSFQAVYSSKVTDIRTCVVPYLAYNVILMGWPARFSFE